MTVPGKKIYDVIIRLYHFLHIVNIVTQTAPVRAALSNVQYCYKLMENRVRFS